MKPMLSATIENTETLKFPLLASPKLDGIRALVIDGKLVSRNLKPIPNAHVQAMFGRPELNGLDGELIAGDPTSPSVFRDTTSAVMSKTGEPDVSFHVFDSFRDPKVAFSERRTYVTLTAFLLHSSPKFVIVPQTSIGGIAELDNYEALALSQGYEGVMLRSANAPYKFGRSTLREQGLMKLKRFVDAEATIVGFDEQMHNGNAATVDALGHTERSTHKAGMTGKGTLGALVVKAINGQFEGVQFSIGSGMDDALRSFVWTNRQLYEGQIVKFKYFPIGSKDAPRFPVFLGFRNDL